MARLGRSGARPPSLRAIMVALCCAAVAAPVGQSAASTRHPVRSHAGAPSETLSGVCRSLGTAEQCECYVPAVEAKLDPTQLAFLRKYLRLRAARIAKYEAATDAYEKQRPLAGLGESLTLTIAVGVSQARDADRDNNLIASEMGGATPYYAMTGVHDAAAEACDLGGTGPSPQAKAAQAQKDAAAAAAAAAERQRQFQEQQAAREAANASERTAHADEVRHEIVGTNGFVDKLISWQTKYGFSTQVGNAVVQRAFRCAPMDSSEWTPDGIVSATDPRTSPKEAYFKLRQQTAGRTLSSCMTLVNLPVSPMYRAGSGGNVELIVWFVPIPLTRDAKGYLPVVRSGEPVQDTGIRVALTEFVNTQLRWTDEAILIPCPQMLVNSRCPTQPGLR